jgi:hypothetical protein
MYPPKKVWLLPIAGSAEVFQVEKIRYESSPALTTSRPCDEGRENKNLDIPNHLFVQEPKKYAAKSWTLCSLNPATIIHNTDYGFLFCSKYSM